MSTLSFGLLDCESDLTLCIKRDNKIYKCKVEFDSQKLITKSNIFKYLSLFNEQKSYKCKIGDCTEVSYDFGYSSGNIELYLIVRVVNEYYEFNENQKLIFVPVTDKLTILNYKLNQIENMMSEQEQIQKNRNRDLDDRLSKISRDRDLDDRLSKMSITDMFCF